jgi:uncharacterized protein YggE
MRLLVLAVLLTLVWGRGAVAETLLHLSETARVSHMPDELVATLEAQASAATPQDAQAQVNKIASAALGFAGKTEGVQVATGPYRTWRLPPPQNQWQSAQSMTLRADQNAAPGLLGLLGRLQQAGLTTADLSWRLSDAQEAAAQAEAMHKAISALQGRAEEAAGLLHLHFTGFRSVDLAPERGGRPGPLVTMRAASVAPSAVPEDTEVTATVEAEAVLAPP